MALSSGESGLARIVGSVACGVCEEALGVSFDKGVWAPFASSGRGPHVCKGATGGCLLAFGYEDVTGGCLLVFGYEGAPGGRLLAFDCTRV